MVVVPWRLRRITIVWPKLRGNVAAEFRGKFDAANRLGLPNLDLDTMGGGGGFGREAAMGSATPRLNWGGGWWCNINWWLLPPVECPEIKSNADIIQTRITIGIILILQKHRIRMVGKNLLKYVEKYFTSPKKCQVYEYQIFSYFWSTVYCISKQSLEYKKFPKGIGNISKREFFRWSS